jgi:hypothetical protein
MKSRTVAWFVAVLSALFALTIAAPTALAGEAEVTGDSPHHPFPRNKQNEPAVAIDASRPRIVAAGSNDEIDLAPCGTTIFASAEGPCPFTPGVGVSGLYLSFDHGTSWVQPTYTGWSARTGVPQVGPIGTLPWYYESDLVSDGDPAVAFGPIRRNGTFSWANGSRLYYANLTSNFPHQAYLTGDSSLREGPPRRARELGVNAEPGPVVGFEAIAVSRADNIDETNYNDKDTWRRPVIASKSASNTQFADKEQIWADNAASSDFFGNVYVCYVAFNGAGAGPLVVATSRDGGSTWRQKNVTPAAASSKIHFGQSGCTIRTNSHGVVYVLYQTFQASLPGNSGHYMVRSYDGGRSWTRPRLVRRLLDNCFVIDPVINRCVEDGIAGARNDLSGSPNIDIANGSPSGANATNEIVDNYVTGPALNQEKVYVQWAEADEPTRARMPIGRGPQLDWSTPQVVSTNGDRGYYTAPAFSPDGSDLYVVYNAYTTPYQATTFTPRGLVGVTRRAAVNGSGSPSGWTTLNRSPVGDPRASSQNDLQAEFLGDYVYVDATNTYGVSVWNDVRDGTVCAAMNAWRMSLREGSTANPPNPVTGCPPGFGDTDIWGYTNFP